ncbi:MAG: glycine--tRNA ligase subunit beta [Gammaproteobacteria bacterium]|nr:glycine--tRNA ligase subunit beta [Gammaproteobacteria bacterium]
MNEKKDLLVEIGTEDLPARDLAGQANELGQLLGDQLAAADLSFNKRRGFCTPRRLTVLLEGLDTRQPDRRVERKGPAKSISFDDKGRPTAAAIGFARSCATDVDRLHIEEDDEPRLVFREQRPGELTRSLLPGLLENVLGKLSIRKRMRWSDAGGEFIRPVRWLLVLFGAETVPLQLFGLTGDRITYGHRFHCPQAISLETPAEYLRVLESRGFVLADFASRQARILEQVEALAANAGAVPVLTRELLDEITGLVEWPRALLGEFDTRFLEVPKEVLISTMQDKQKFIPLMNEAGELLPQFILISNLDSRAPERVRQGNEKVIVPRFEDARFFWQRDLGLSLESRIKKLKDVVFEKQLGSMYDKTRRVGRLAATLAGEVGLEPEPCRRAAELGKCDLLTEIVGEFPELQGIAGRYLALHDGEGDEVATAIEEQYLPRQAGDVLPSSPCGSILAIADRLDTLAGIFAIGKKPTGLKDPYGLRRAALAVLRILIETGLDTDLHASLEQAVNLLPQDLNRQDVADEVFSYMNKRLHAYFAGQDFAADVIESVLANRPPRPHDIAARINALSSFRKREEADSLAAANKRIRNILKKTGYTDTAEVRKELFREKEEGSLHAAIEALAGEVEELFHQHDYEQALRRLASLRQPIDSFFDHVMVMDDNETIRANRLAMLARIDALFMHVADFSRLQS